MSLKNIDGNKKINSISKKIENNEKTNQNRNTCFEINAFLQAIKKQQKK